MGCQEQGTVIASSDTESSFYKQRRILELWSDLCKIAMVGNKLQTMTHRDSIQAEDGR